MGIALSTHFDSLILIFGGVLIFILGFVFYQLAFLQKTGTGTAVVSSNNLVKNQRELPAKREKEGTVKHEPVRLVKPETEQPGQQQKREHLKPQKEKLEKQQNDGRSSFIKKLFKFNTRKAAKPDEETVGIGASSRMPKLSSLGIKDGKSNSEKSDAEAKAIVMEMNLTATGTNLAAGTDVISAMAAVASQGVTTTTPKDETVVPTGPEIKPVSTPTIILATPPAAKPAPVLEVPKEEKKEEKSDRVRDMFANDDDEESESNKFAKNLEQVDIQDLLTESQTLINSFVRRGK